MLTFKVWKHCENVQRIVKSWDANIDLSTVQWNSPIVEAVGKISYKRFKEISINKRQPFLYACAAYIRTAFGKIEDLAGGEHCEEVGSQVYECFEVEYCEEYPEVESRSLSVEAICEVCAKTFSNKDDLRKHQQEGCDIQADLGYEILRKAWAKWNITSVDQELIKNRKLKAIYSHYELAKNERGELPQDDQCYMVYCPLVGGWNREARILLYGDIDLDTTSHICGNAYCVRLCHIWHEELYQNIQRENCFAKGECYEEHKSGVKCIFPKGQKVFKRFHRVYNRLLPAPPA